MTITQEIISGIDVFFERSLRTEHSEEYAILTKSDIEELGRGDSPYTELGLVTIQFVEQSLDRDDVSIRILLKKDWSEDAVKYLETLVEHRLVSAKGGGKDNEVHIETYSAELITTYSAGGLSSDRLVYQIAEKVSHTNEKIDELPEKLSEEVDVVIEKQLAEIDDLLDTEEEETRQAIRDQLKVGLERGLPTLLYETGIEEEY